MSTNLGSSIAIPVVIVLLFLHSFCWKNCDVNKIISQEVDFGKLYHIHTELFATITHQSLLISDISQITTYGYTYANKHSPIYIYTCVCVR